MSIVKGPKESGVIQVGDPVHFRNSVSGVGSVVQGDELYVDNSNVNANDDNSGKSLENPKLTIQSAIDAAPADSGSVVYVMGSGVTYEYYAANVINATGSALYGVYRENVHLDATDHGLQLIGVNRPFITGNDGTSENDGSTPTIQIGNWGVNSYGPKYCRISGFLIGGWGDNVGDVGNANRKGVGICIGDYYDATLNDDCYSHTIDNCVFRATNCAGGGNYTNTVDVHTWIKGFGNEKITVRDCSFFQGYYGVGLMSNQNNKAMQWLIDDCQFWYQTTACLMGGSTIYWSLVKDSIMHPATAEQEFDMTGTLGSSIVNCYFPMCDEAVLTNSAKVNTPLLGTHTGWNVMGCHGQKGLVYGA